MNELIFALTLLAAPGAPADVCSLTVTVEGLPSDEGTVRFFLADSATSYGDHDRGPGAGRALIEPHDGKAVWELGALPCGEYAIRVHHDADGDGKLGHNFVGMPTEAYAFSNDARGFMGPPSWDEAKFTLAGPTALVLKAAH